MIQINLILSIFKITLLSLLIKYISNEQKGPLIGAPQVINGKFDTCLALHVNQLDHEYIKTYSTQGKDIFVQQKLSYNKEMIFYIGRFNDEQKKKNKPYHQIDISFTTFSDNESKKFEECFISNTEQEMEFKWLELEKFGMDNNQYIKNVKYKKTQNNQLEQIDINVTTPDQWVKGSELCEQQELAAKQLYIKQIHMFTYTMIKDFQRKVWNGHKKLSTKINIMKKDLCQISANDEIKIQKIQYLKLSHENYTNLVSYYNKNDIIVAKILSDLKPLEEFSKLDEITIKTYPDESLNEINIKIWNPNNKYSNQSQESTKHRIGKQWSDNYVQVKPLSDFKEEFVQDNEIYKKLIDNKTILKFNIVGTMFINDTSSKEAKNSSDQANQQNGQQVIAFRGLYELMNMKLRVYKNGIQLMEKSVQKCIINGYCHEPVNTNLTEKWDTVSPHKDQNDEEQVQVKDFNINKLLMINQRILINVIKREYRMDISTKEEEKLSINPKEQSKDKSQVFNSRDLKTVKFLKQKMLALQEQTNVMEVFDHEDINFYNTTTCSDQIKSLTGLNYNQLKKEKFKKMLKIHGTQQIRIN